MSQTILAGLAGGAQLQPGLDWARIFGQSGQQDPVGAFDPNGNAARAPDGVAQSNPDFGSVAEGGRSWDKQSTGLSMASNLSKGGTVGGMTLGVPGFGLAGAGLGAYLDTRNADDMLDKAYGLPDAKTNGLSAFGAALSWGLIGKSAFDQMANFAGDAYSNKTGVFSNETFERNRAAFEDAFPTTPTAPVAPVSSEPLGGYGPSGEGLSRDGTPDSPGQDGMGNGGNAWAQGGPVTRERLRGPNPAGPDDGYGALDAGEHVINAKASQYYGPMIMQALNEGRVPRHQLAMLLLH